MKFIERLQPQVKSIGILFTRISLLLNWSQREC